MPKVTVLLPTYQSERYIKECLESILKQNYDDFELLVIDAASTDKTVEIIDSFRDSRVHIIQEQGEGLADALNQGLLSANGEYIARIDADDLMARSRLERQVNYMDENRETAVCGSWQQYFGLRSYCHKPSISAEQCKADLLFRCNLCHSTLMLRKAVFLENNLLYDKSFEAEDFELWTRVLDYGNIENIPEILGYYRDYDGGITKVKMDRLIREHGEIVASTLKRNLRIELNPEQKKLFPGWVSPFHDPRSGISPEEKSSAIENLEKLFKEILATNHAIGYYNEDALKRTIAAEWAALRYRMPYAISKGQVSDNQLFRKRSRFELLFFRTKRFFSEYRELRQKYIAIKRKLKG
jgi:glycosyltransferase involved in cell wall biosynthesis